MKKLLFMLTLCLGAGTIYAQEVHDADHHVRAYINHDGSLKDASNVLLGSFKTEDETIRDRYNHVIGYLSNHQFTDASHNVVGFMQHDGTVEDSHHNPVGYINEHAGTVKDASHTLIGYLNIVEPEWAAAYFFLYTF